MSISLALAVFVTEYSRIDRKTGSGATPGIRGDLSRGGGIASVSKPLPGGPGEVLEAIEKGNECHLPAGSSEGGRFCSGTASSEPVREGRRKISGESDEAIVKFMKAKLKERPGLSHSALIREFRAEGLKASGWRFRWLYDARILGKECGDDFRKYVLGLKAGRKDAEEVKAAGRAIDEKVHDLATKLGKLKVEEKEEVGFRSSPIPKTPEKTLREYKENVESYVVRAATALRMDPNTFRTKLTNVLKATTANADVWIRISPVNFDKVLADGRFKNQHESKTSEGTFDPELRRGFEQKFWGVSRKADYATGHPIYGYLSGREDGLGTTPDGYDAPGGYGSIRVKLKSSARERSTFTVGDSLHNDYRIDQLAERVTSPTYKAFPKWGLLDSGEDYLRAKSIDEIARHNSYAEAQIFGGVKLSDIDHVAFNYKDQYAKFKGKLEKLGVASELLPGAKEKGLPDWV